MLKLNNFPLYLYLSSIFLVSFGASRGAPVFLWIGLAAIVLAALILPAQRFFVMSRGD